jgi:hypothetical protein
MPKVVKSSRSRVAQMVCRSRADGGSDGGSDVGQMVGRMVRRWWVGCRADGGQMVGRWWADGVQE